MKIIKSYLIEIIFFICLLLFQTVYFWLSVSLEVILNEDFIYLILIEIFIFVLYISFKEWCIYNEKLKKFVLNNHFIEKMKKNNNKILEQKNRIDEDKKLYEELLDIIFGYVHELKNPISAIKLSNPPKDIKNEIFRLEEVIERLLYTSKISDISNDLFINNYSLSDITKDLVKRYKTIFIAKKINLIYEVEDIKIYTDYKWLVFALSQIISNALKYTSKNGEIIIRTGKKEGKNYLEIKDNGCGIDPSYKHRIFDKGFSIDKTNIKYKGTGLGLYISNKIFEYLNVDYSVESELNIGTSFKFYFKGESLYFSNLT